MSKFCAYCGKENENNTQFCPNCGAKCEVMQPQVNNISNGFNNSFDYNNTNNNYNNQTITNNNSYSNGMGIAGLVISIVSWFFCCGGLSWLSLIFSIIGLNNSKKHNGVGKGISIAGIIVSAIGLAIILLFIFFFSLGVMEGLAEI